MKIKLIEDPLYCPVCNTRMTGLASHDRQCNSCGMPCYLMFDTLDVTNAPGLFACVDGNPTKQLAAPRW
jgi:hypothetical protein